MSILKELLQPDLTELHPRKPLIIGIGAVSGLPGPSTCRTSISGQSPETGLLGDSNIGGHFAGEMRTTGYHHLVVQGRAEELSILVVRKDKISIDDASDLQGSDTNTATEQLLHRYSPRAQSLVIGPAGESMVRFACIRHGLKSAAGRTGLGCLMGSKNLKAIVVIGEGKAEAASREELARFNKEATQRIAKTRATDVLSRYGTPFLFDLHNRQGILRVWNGQKSILKNAESIRCTRLTKHYHGKGGCFSCSVRCRHHYTVPSGPHAGMEAEGPDYGTLGAFGPICGITGANEILVLNDLVNRLGLDSVSTGNLIAWVIEMSQKGMLSDNVSRRKLEWGDYEAVRRLIEEIVNAKDLGGTLARGARLAKDEFGEDSSRLLWWIKGLIQSDSVDVRAFRGFSLSAATSTRGADHLRSRPTMEALSLPEDVLAKIYGGKVSPDPLSYCGKARMVWWTESLYAVADALGICKFVLKFNNPFLLGFEELAELLRYGTGLELTPEELFRVGTRIVGIERDILKELGVTRRDDMLPDRYFETIPDGPLKDSGLDRAEFNKMLDEYYRLHGWDMK